VGGANRFKAGFGCGGGGVLDGIAAFGSYFGVYFFKTLLKMLPSGFAGIVASLGSYFGLSL
jgi:hypothetical protein